MNINDLMKRYKVSSQAIRKFVRQHIDEINEEGVEHARQIENGWFFDAEAVEKIDKLKGLDKVGIRKSQRTRDRNEKSSKSTNDSTIRDHKKPRRNSCT